MGRTRSTAIRSGPKLSQPSASASSPMTDIEAAYMHVYDDLDKRKTHKGWQQRKMRWVKGHKVLKELLQDPALPGSKASEWSAWSQEELVVIIESEQISIDRLLDYHHAVLSYLHEHIILPNLGAFSGDTLSQVVGTGSNKILVTSSTVPASGSDGGPQGILGRVMTVVTVVIESIKDVRIDSDDAGSFHAAAPFHTAKWLSLLIELLRCCRGGSIDQGETSDILCELLWTISWDTNDDSGRKVLADESILGLKKLGGLLLTSQTARSSLYLFRLLHSILPKRNPDSQAKGAALLTTFPVSEWGKEPMKAVYYAIGTLRDHHSLAPLDYCKAINAASEVPGGPRPKGFRITSYSIDAKDEVGLQKAQERLKKGEVILYVDRWRLVVLPFDDVGIEETHPFVFERITGFGEQSGSFDAGGGTVFGFEYVADPLDPHSRSRTVCVGIHKDEAEDFQLLMQSKLPGFRLSKVDQTTEKPDQSADVPLVALAETQVDDLPASQPGAKSQHVAERQSKQSAARGEFSTSLNSQSHVSETQITGGKAEPVANNKNLSKAVALEPVASSDSHEGDQEVDQVEELTQPPSTRGRKGKVTDRGTRKSAQSEPEADDDRSREQTGAQLSRQSGDGSAVLRIVRGKKQSSAQADSLPKTADSAPPEETRTATGAKNKFWKSTPGPTRPESSSDPLAAPLAGDGEAIMDDLQESEEAEARRLTESSHLSGVGRPSQATKERQQPADAKTGSQAGQFDVQEKTGESEAVKLDVKLGKGSRAQASDQAKHKIVERLKSTDMPLPSSQHLPVQEETATSRSKQKYGRRRKSPQKKTEEPESLPDNDDEEVAEPVAEEPEPKTTKRKAPARAAKPSGASGGGSQSTDAMTPKAKSVRGKKSDAFKAPTPVKPTLASTIEAGRGATEKKEVAAQSKPSGTKASSKGSGTKERKGEEVQVTGHDAGPTSESLVQDTGLGSHVGDPNSAEYTGASAQPFKQPKEKGKKAAASVQPPSLPQQVESHLGQTNHEPDNQHHEGSGGSHAAGAEAEIAPGGPDVLNGAPHVDDSDEVESVRGASSANAAGRAAIRRELEADDTRDITEMPRSADGREPQDAHEEQQLPRLKVPTVHPRKPASPAKQSEERDIQNEPVAAVPQRRPSGGHPTARTRIDQPAGPKHVQVGESTEKGETGTGQRPSTPHQQEDDGAKERVVHDAKVAEEAPKTPGGDAAMPVVEPPSVPRVTEIRAPRATLATRTEMSETPAAAKASKVASSAQRTRPSSLEGNTGLKIPGGSPEANSPLPVVKQNADRIDFQEDQHERHKADEAENQSSPHVTLPKPSQNRRTPVSKARAPPPPPSPSFASDSEDEDGSEWTEMERMALVQNTVREMMAAGKITPQTGKRLLRATNPDAAEQSVTFSPSATSIRPAKRKAVRRASGHKYQAESEDEYDAADEDEGSQHEEFSSKKKPKLSKLHDVVQPKRANIPAQQAQRKAEIREVPAVDEAVEKRTVNERMGKRKSSLRGTATVEVPSKRVRLSTSDGKENAIAKPKGAFGSDVAKPRSGLEVQKTELMQKLDEINQAVKEHLAYHLEIPSKHAQGAQLQLAAAAQKIVSSLHRETTATLNPLGELFVNVREKYQSFHDQMGAVVEESRKRSRTIRDLVKASKKPAGELPKALFA